MSNSLAIAAVSETLRRSIQDALVGCSSDHLDGALVRCLRPSVASGAGASGLTVHVYLYQITPNAAARNRDLPIRNASGDLVQRPRLALDLSYLLTFHGDEASFEPQRLLGAVTAHLHAHPLLSIAAIQAMIASAKSHPTPLGGSDLDADQEPLRISPISLTLEEISKLWSVLLQVPHALSVAYQVSTVFLDGAPPVAPAPRPSRIGTFGGAPLSAPALLGIEPQVARSGETLRLRANTAGRRPATLSLRGVSTGQTLQIAEEEPVHETWMSLRVPKSLLAGVVSVTLATRDETRADDGERGPTLERESNPVSFVLLPFIVDLRFDAAASLLVIEVSPAVGPHQRVHAILGELRIPALPFGTPGKDGTTELRFDVSNIPPRTSSPVLLDVDGTISLPDPQAIWP